jgi:uncharacterized protein
MTHALKTVVVLGASRNPERYSNRAVKMLKEQGYHTIPVNPVCDEIEGLKVVSNLTLIEEKVYALSIYLSPKKIKPLIESIISLKPERVIFNPGSESVEIEERLQESGIFYEEACTLVLLSTGQF